MLLEYDPEAQNETIQHGGNKAFHVPRIRQARMPEVFE
jgi:hypothetical protein